MADDDLGNSGGPSVLGAVLPFATALASLGLGAVLGFAIAWIVKPSERVEVAVARNLTDAELAAACAPAIADKARDLEDAHEKVRDLSANVATKEARVAELETEMAQRAERGRAMVQELERAKAELAEMKVQLEAAVQEKERLYQELTVTTAKLEQTEQALEEQIVKTEVAREDALTNKWYRFINDAQLEICERGNRKKLGNCREVVQAKLLEPATRDKFSHCVRSRQATPLVREIEKDAQLPEFAQWIDQDDKITRDWYIDLCDPTLPEAEDGTWEEDHLPGSDAPGASGTAAPGGDATPGPFDDPE